MTEQCDPTRSAAIIGIGLRFPGGLYSIDEFWRFLIEGGDAITEIPTNRMDIERLYDPEPATAGRIMTRFGGFLNDIDRFDARFFGIAPREAESMDPSQRLVLETAWEAIEDAGIDAAKLRGRPIGVFVGQWITDFESRLLRHPEATDFHTTTGSGRYATPGRLSHFLGLQGPSLSLDTACASSLTAVHMALQSLRTGESEMAFAAGVNVILSPHITIGYSQSRMMAPDGHCKFGDASGDGYVRSEGAAMLLLKRLDRALESGDQIHAILRGSAVNNDGRSGLSFGTPGPDGQERLLRTALADAGAEAGQIDYVEAHGTGTRKGDPIELGTIGKVMGPGRKDNLPVGSVKTNLGHTEAAAGMAGLIKTALILKHREIPPSLHLRDPNPEVNWDGLRLTIPTSRATLPAENGVWLAGVNNFGIAGSNSHVVLQSPPPPPGARPSGRCALTGFAPTLPISAQTKLGMQALAACYLERAERATADGLTDLCAAAALRRTGLRERAVLGGSGPDDLLHQLRALASGEKIAIQGVAPESMPKIVFVAPGQGGQWQGMAQELLRNSPVFRDTIAACSAALAEVVDWRLEDQLSTAESPANARIDVIQPTLVALAISYAALLRAMGLRPDMVIGHSMGEIAAAAISGNIGLAAAMRIVARRSLLMAGMSGTGGMALVELAGDVLEDRLLLTPLLGLAARNGPRSSVVSGETEALDAFLATLEAEGIFCRRVKVDVASHSPQMEPLAKQLTADLAGLSTRQGDIPIISTVLGREVAGAELDATYWGRNLRQPVLFESAVRATLEAGCTVFVELGPHPVLLPSIKDISLDVGEAVHAVACGKRDVSDCNTLVAAATELWAVGAPLDWQTLYERSDATVNLPSYPWQRERHWVQEAEVGFGPNADRLSQPDRETQSWLYHLNWQVIELPQTGPVANTSEWLILSGEPQDPLAAAISNALEATGAKARVASYDGAFVDESEGVSIIALAPPTSAAPWLPVALHQNLLASGARPRQIVFATRGAMTPEAGTATRQGDPDQAALWGAARVVAQEQLDLPIRIVDMEVPAEPDQSAMRLVRGLSLPADEDEIVLRGAECFVPRLKRGLAVQAAGALPWRSDAACLITGGLGGVGMRIARRLASEGARHLVLLGRTELPPRADWQAIPTDSPIGLAIAALCSIEACGASVHYIAADVSDEAAMRTALDGYRNEKRPPIQALIHAAGTVRNGLSAQMTAANFDAVFTAKLDGAKVLDRLLPDLDLFVVFSSIAATLAPVGMANYAAANAGIEAIAERRRQQGRPSFSVQWAAWDGTGMHEQKGDFTESGELERAGARSLQPDRLEPLLSLISRSGRSAIVMDMDWTVFATSANRNRSAFRELAVGAGQAPVLLSALPDTATPQERRALILDLVRKSAGSVLQLAPATIDPNMALGALGLNSLMAIELRAELERSMGCRLPATIAWNYPTVTALARHLAERSDKASPTLAPQNAKKSKGNIEDIGFSLDDLAESLLGSSDDDIANALRQNRKGARE